MTLKQKLAIAFFRTKIKSVALVSVKKAATIAFELFCTPYSGKPKRKMPTLFTTAEPLTIMVKKVKVRGFQFNATHNNNGKTILIVHGFDSYCYKFEHFIKPFIQLGFRVLLFDAPGHGQSDGNTLHSIQYRETIWTINKKIGPIHIIMAHSIGALAASFAAEEMPLLEKLILIAPPENIDKPIADFTRLLKLSDTVQLAFLQIIQHIAKVPVSWFSVGRALQKIQIPVLWAHDTEDAICLYKDVAPVQQLQLPHVQFYITTGLGHSKIYKQKETVKTITNFIQSFEG
jgi:pimeloyl-ACP methyl ester carboxylesterase